MTHHQIPALGKTRQLRPQRLDDDPLHRTPVDVRQLDLDLQITVLTGQPPHQMGGRGAPQHP